MHVPPLIWIMSFTKNLTSHINLYDFTIYLFTKGKMRIVYETASQFHFCLNFEVDRLWDLVFH